MTFLYDTAGNETFSQSLAGPEVERTSYYGADGRVRAIDARTSYGNLSAWTRAFDEYRYDALGRRILVRSRKSCYAGSFGPPFAAECASSLVRRTVWDGDQMLAEIQMPGGDADIQYWENDTAAVLLPSFQSSGSEDPARYFGRIVYTHAGGIDHPLAVTRYQYVHAVDLNGQPQQPTLIPRVTIMPFWNTLGDGSLGAFSDGTAMIYCVTQVSNCEDVTWPYRFSAYNRHGGGVVGNWQGSFLEGGRDKSGLEFRRNRLYDPQTGRFTQEDPLGLAGGLNLYGFANGDPVNFSDPFGLCNDPAKPECKGLGQQAYESLRNAVGSLVNKISGGLASARDALTGREPGTTQNAVANAVLNPPDIGSVDPSVTLNIGPAALTVRPDALVVGVQPSDELSVTLDATYTLPGQHPGFEASAGAEGSLEGVIVGGSVNTAGGKVTGFTGSLGVGLGAKEKARVDPVLVIPFGTIPF